MATNIPIAAAGLGLFSQGTNGLLTIVCAILLVIAVALLWSILRLRKAIDRYKTTVNNRQEDDTRALEILEHTTDAFFQTDKNYIIQYANQKGAELLHLDHKNLVGRTLWDLFPEAVSSTFFYQFRQSQEEKVAAEFETYFAPDESWFAVHAYPTSETFSIYFRDITDQKWAEAALKESENRYRALFDSLGDGALVYRDNRLLDANFAACQNLGYTREQLLSLPLSTIDGLLSGPGADLMHSQLKRTGSASFETEHIRIDGSRLPVWVHARIVDYLGEPAVLAIARDMTERRNQDRQLEQMATTDPLTNAFNRRHFMETARRLTKACRRRGDHFNLMMLDLDHFKKLNDSYGHDFGDRALVHFSQLCQQKLRDRDLFCRLGGEEFAAILPEGSLDSARQVAERLRQALEMSSLTAENGDDVQMTVSIGIANSRQLKEPNHNRLLALADRALYDAKNRGRNQVCIYELQPTESPAQEEATA